VGKRQAPTPMVSLRDFARSGLLLGDHGKPLVITPLVEQVIKAYEGDYDFRVVVTPRRQGKSSAIALLALYELLCVPNSFVVWLSGGVQQAADIIRQKLQIPIAQSPKLSGLKIYSRTTGRLEHPEIGSIVECFSTNTYTSQGRTISLLLIDEAKAVPDDDAYMLFPAAANGRIFAVSSPGPPRGWFYQSATSPGPKDFVFHSREVTNNPTLDLGFVEAQRERMQRLGVREKLLYKREWGGEFIDLLESALVSPDDIERASREEVRPYDARVDKTFIGVDLSLVRDLTSIVVVSACLPPDPGESGMRDPRAMPRDTGATSRDVEFRVLEAVVLDPQAFGGKISLSYVESRIQNLAQRYRAKLVSIDQWQGALMSERLRSRGIKVRLINPTAALNMEVYELLVEVLRDGRLEFARNHRLEAELLNLSIEETRAGGFRVIDAERSSGRGGARLHRDLSFSLALALSAASERGHYFEYEPGFDIIMAPQERRVAAV
jgi:phage terminase large subunit-like protein